jgi:hypothetical protein
MMKPWYDRPIEIRNLFNPAFCGVLLARAIKAFEAEDERGMPYSLSLLVLPLSLHRESRQAICASNKAYFLKVVDGNPELLVGFPGRARSYLHYTFEAFGMLMHTGSIQVRDDGRIKLVPRRVSPQGLGSAECRECEQAAKLLGREFARLRDRVTIYTMLGVKP